MSMFFEKRARQACAKFIEYDPGISLLRLRQYMYLLEETIVLKYGEPLVNGTIALIDSPQLKEIDESYLENLPEYDGELSPRERVHMVLIVAGSQEEYDLRCILNKDMSLYKKHFPDKSELDWIDILRAHGTPEEEIKEYKEEFEYYLCLLKQLND